MAHVTDPFTGTSGDALNVYNANWVRHGSYTAATLIIDSTNGRCRNSNTAGQNRLYYRSEDPGADIYEVQVQDVLVGAEDGSIGGPAIRVSTSANTYYSAILGTAAAGTTNFTLRKKVAGAETTLGTVTHTFATGVTYTITIGVNGTNIYARVQRSSNSQWLKSDGTWQAGQINCLSVTDSAISARGKMGLFTYGHVASDTTGPHFDNFDGGVDVALAPGVGSVAARTHNSLAVTFVAASGGTNPYTYTNHRLASINDTPNAGNKIAGTDNLLSFTDTGLTADTRYVYKQIVTDSVAATAASDYLLQATGRTTRPVALVVPIIYQSGDSITSGGSPQSVTTMGTTLEGLLNTTGIAAGASGVAGGGIGAFVNADLTPTATLIAHKDAMVAAGSTDWQARIGINDAGTVAAGTFKDKLQAAVDYVTANVPTVARIWLLYQTFAWDYFAARVIAPADRYAALRLYQQAQREIAAASDNPAGVRVYAGNPWVYDLFADMPSLTTDGIHPTQAGYNMIGQLDAYHWFATVTEGLGSGGGGGGGGVGANLSGGLLQ